MKFQRNKLIEFLIYFFTVLLGIIITRRIGSLGYRHVTKMNWIEIYNNLPLYIGLSILAAFLLLMLNSNKSEKND